MSGRYVSYLRAAFDLEAQRKAVEDYLNGGGRSVIAEFVEVENGERPKLADDQDNKSSGAPPEAPGR